MQLGFDVPLGGRTAVKLRHRFFFVAFGASACLFVCVMHVVVRVVRVCRFVEHLHACSHCMQLKCYDHSYFKYVIALELLDCMLPPLHYQYVSFSMLLLYLATCTPCQPHTKTV